jgi:hypothetical protein
MNSRKIGGNKGKGKNRAKSKAKSKGKRMGKDKNKTNKNTVFTQAQNRSSSSNSSDITKPIVELLILMHGAYPINTSLIYQQIPKMTSKELCVPTSFCFYYPLENDVTILSEAQTGCILKKVLDSELNVITDFIPNYSGQNLFDSYNIFLNNKFGRNESKIEITDFNMSNKDTNFNINTLPIKGEKKNLSINKKYRIDTNYEHDGIYIVSPITVLTKFGVKEYPKGYNLLLCPYFKQYTKNCSKMMYNKEMFLEEEETILDNIDLTDNNRLEITTKDAVINFFQDCDIHLIDGTCGILFPIGNQTNLKYIERICQDFSADFYDAIGKYP